MASREKVARWLKDWFPRAFVNHLAAENAKLREALERIAIYTGSRAAKIATEALEKK